MTIKLTDQKLYMFISGLMFSSILTSIYFRLNPWYVILLFIVAIAMAFIGLKEDETQN